YVTVKDTINGICALTSIDTVHIDLSPRVLDIFNNDTVVCEGTTVFIKVGGTPGYAYHWSPATGVNDTTAQNPEITIFEPNTYKVTASYPNCRDTTAFITIGMQFMPRVDLRPDRAVCQGVEVGLESKISPYRNDYSYQWSPVTPGFTYPNGP